MSVGLHLDFETRSDLDLPEVGLHNYLLSPHTAIWCMAYAIGDGPVELWIPGEPIPDDVAEHIYEGRRVVAHNAPFEMQVWNALIRKQYGVSPIVPMMCDCTMARAYAMDLPGSLNNASLALGIADGKDMSGHRLMLQMARPRKVFENGTIQWWDDAERLHRLYEYCRQDVVTEREVEKRTVPLTPYEHKIWQMDYTINQRGFAIDVGCVKKAVSIVEAERHRAEKEIRELTDGAIGSPTEHQRFPKWCAQNGAPYVTSVAKDVLGQHLERKDLPEKVRKVLLLRQEIGRTSVSKLFRMLELVCPDGRIREQFQYCGAGKTGRWAGRDVQPHNMPRPNMKQDRIDAGFAILEKSLTVSQYIEAFKQEFEEPITEVLVNMLRGMIVAGHGKTLVAGDYSNIEGRGIAWLAGEQWKLDAFEEYDIGIGPDLYKLIYHKSFGTPLADIDDKKRQIGKVQELALGFGGGKGAFQQMASSFGVKVSDEEAERIKDAWRTAHPRIVDMWKEFEDLAVAAVRYPESKQIYRSTYCKIIFYMNGSFLWVRLPSGRDLCYPYPRIEPVLTPWGAMKDALTYMKMNTTTYQYERTSTYGGKIAENITQAACRDKLADAMLALHENGHEIVVHVHDESVEEWIDNGSENNIAELMENSSPWAKGLPAVVDPWVARRYKK